MPLYDVLRQNGTVIRIDALTPSLASQMVRYPGELIKSVSLVRTTGTGIPIVPSATTPTPMPRAYAPGAPKTPVPEIGQRAYAPGVPKIPIKEGVTIPATAGELKIIADAKAKGLCVGTMKAYYTIKTYQVGTRDGQKIRVEAMSPEAAKQKATTAGYKVSSVTRYLGLNLPTRVTKVPTPSVSSNEVAVKDGGTGQTLVFPKSAWDSLPSEYQKVVTSQGFDAMTAKYNQDYATTTAITNKVQPYKAADGTYNLTRALAEGAITKDEAYSIFNKDSVNQSLGWIELAKAKSPGEFAGTISPVSGQRTATLAEMEAYKGSMVSVQTMGIFAAEMVVPYLYTIRHWNELPAWERAAWIALDTALFIVPLSGAAVRGARGVTVAAEEAGRLARVAGAAKNVGRELFVMVKAPLETAIHPVAATKQGVRDIRAILENMVRLKTVPHTVLTTTEGTARLSLTKATTVEEYMRVRDTLIRAAANGERPIVELRNSANKVIATVELNKAPLMRELKGGVVHTTPWGRQFVEGFQVTAKPGMPLSEQGLFVSHEPLPRFAQQSAFNMPVDIGAEKRGAQVISTRFGAGQVANLHLESKLPQDALEKLASSNLIQTEGKQIQSLSSAQLARLDAVLRQTGNAKVADQLADTVNSYKPIFRIMSSDKAKELVGTEKVYRGTVEMEAKFPVGTKIEPPKQILFTRIGPERAKVEIWLDKPLSTKQIMKLKAEGLAEVFRQPFRFPVEIKGIKGSLTKEQLRELARVIEGAGNRGIARSLERAYDLARTPTRLAQMAMGVARQPARITERTRAVARAERLERIEPRERVERVEQTERPKRARREERRERVERVTRRERAERVERIGRRVRTPERVRRVERPERQPRPERPIRLERVPRIRRPSRPVRIPRPAKLTRMKTMALMPAPSKQKRLHEGPALAVWKQGRVWVSIFPPFRTTGKQEDVVYSLKRPSWASVIARGRHAPRKTLKSMGKVPQVITVPMGVVTARITNGLHLTFSRRRHRGRIIEW